MRKRNKYALEIGYSVCKFLCIFHAFKYTYDKTKHILTFKISIDGTIYSIHLDVKEDILPGVLLDLGIGKVEYE